MQKWSLNDFSETSCSFKAPCELFVCMQAELEQREAHLSAAEATLGQATILIEKYVRKTPLVPTSRDANPEHCRGALRRAGTEHTDPERSSGGPLRTVHHLKSGSYCESEESSAIQSSMCISRSEAPPGSPQSVFSPCAKAFERPRDIFGSIEGLLAKLECQKSGKAQMPRRDVCMHASIAARMQQSQHGHRSCVF